MITERVYQAAAKDAMFDYWEAGGGNPLVNMATGTGKSVVIAKLAEKLLRNYDGFRILMTVHVKELVTQNAQNLLRVWPQAPLGINSASLGRRDRHSQILYTSIQSIYKNGRELGERDLVLVDEAHLLPREGQGMYRTLLDDLQSMVPHVRVGGFTATPYRLDSGRLDEGSGRMFDEVVYSYDLAEAVQDGWCAPLRGIQTDSEIDVSGVGRKSGGGDFKEEELEIEADKIVKASCREIVERGKERKSWIAFCAGVNNAILVRDELRSLGITAETVSYKTPDRDSVIRAFREGRIRCLTNANVLTTGFDAPNLDMIAMLRPTLSTGLYVQMLGRGTRPVFPRGFVPDAVSSDERKSAIHGSTKSNCLVLDFAGNCRRHGPVDAVSVETKKKVDGGKKKKTEPDTVNAKICPACQTYNPPSILACSHCGFEWPVDGPKHSAEPDTAPVMTCEVIGNDGKKWITVDDVRLDRHRKFGDGPDSLLVEYVCGKSVYKEWVCFDHSKTHPSRAKAEAWWRAMGGKTPAPSDVDDAIKRADELEIVEAVTILREGKYWKVNVYRFGKYEINSKFQRMVAQ